LPFENPKLILFYRIREVVKIIKIITQCKIIKSRELKKKNILKFLILTEIFTGS